MSTGVSAEAALRRLGRLRKKHRSEDEQLADAIRAAIVEARDSGMPMTRVAELLGIDRTQIYRTYLRS